MTSFDNRLKPDFRRAFTLPEIVSSYPSADAALTAGNYYVALLKAQTEGDAEIAGAAMVMCGAIERGLKDLQAEEKLGQLSDRSKNIQAYGRWCRGDTNPPHFNGANGLNELLGKETINVLMLHGPHTRHGIPAADPAGFTLHSVSLDRDEAAARFEDLSPDGFSPDAVIVLDIYGSRLPDDLYDFDGPIIFLNYDFDFQIPHQYEDLERADLIVVNSAYEHILIDGIYPGPVAALPTHAVTFDQLKFSDPGGDKSLDFFHSGLSFTPIMREKAQFLFRLAIVDDADISMKIHHGFLSSAEYRENVSSAKYMPIHNGRMNGGITSRTMDAICNGSISWQVSGDCAIELLGAARPVVQQTDSTALEDGLRQSVADFDHQWAEIEDTRSQITNELVSLFDSLVEPESGFLKFCLFEAARRRGEDSAQPQRQSTRRLTGSGNLDDVMLAARRNDDRSHSYYCRATMASLQKIIKIPADEERKTHAELIFSEAFERYPDSVVLPFNHGRVLWAIDDRARSVDLLSRVVEGASSGRFDPRREEIWLHLFKGTAEMTPYQDYFMALSYDLAASRSDTPSARHIIAATAGAYVALDDLQNGNLAEGLNRLDQALNHHAEHFPAAKLRFKALHAMAEQGSGDWAEVAKAFDLAVNLYPPMLTELLPFGVSAELAQDDEAAALDLVKTWTYFATRVTWEKEDDHPIPALTWKCVGAFLGRLPAHLQDKLKDRYGAELQKTSP